jgi:hypothetical protein
MQQHDTGHVTSVVVEKLEFDPREARRALIDSLIPVAQKVA